MHITRLTNTSLEQIRRTIEEAFSDYELPVRFSMESLRDMMVSRDLSLEYSFGCFEKDALVGCILGGFRDNNGKPTIYNGTTGVIPEFRGKGIGAQLQNELLTYAKEHAIPFLQLEVLEQNHRAQSLYSHAGFIENRVLHCFTIEKLNLEKPTIQNSYYINPLNKSDFMKINHAAFLDYVPSWQNSVRSVLNAWNHFAVLAVMKQDIMVGYGIIHRIQGNYPQIAVANDSLTDMIRTVLIYALAQLCESPKLTVINVEKQSTLANYLKSSGWENYINQIEMIHTVL